MPYLDNNSSSSAAPEVLDAMAAVNGAADQTIEEARISIAELLGSTADEIFISTSGTASIETAFSIALNARPKCRHVITSSVDHDSVLQICRNLASSGYRVTLLDVDECGRLDPSQLNRALSVETALVSIMEANHETGIIFPIKEIAATVRRHSTALLHSDGAVAAGNMPIDLKNSDVDLYSISGKKFHGPDRIGALYIRQAANICRDSMEENLDYTFTRSIAGLGAAARLATDDPAIDKMRRLRDRLEDSILALLPDAYINGTDDRSERLANTSSISFENANGEMIAERLATLGTIVSTASACGQAGQPRPGVLQALNIPYTRAAGSIRFSLGRFNTDDDIEEAIDSVRKAVAHARSFS